MPATGSDTSLTGRRRRRGAGIAIAAGLVLTAGAVAGSPLQASADSHGAPTVEGPIPGTAPGDPGAADVEDTYPFFSTYIDLESSGFVEEEFYISGGADAYASDGTLLDTDVDYRTRIIVRRPADDRDFNGTVLMEWQNVSAGYDLDALWTPDHVLRSGYAWIGVSAQRVGVQQLTGWSNARYGDLDVTGGGAHVLDELSYDIFAQAAEAVKAPGEVDAMGGLDVAQVLAIGASQSAGRMTVYYDEVLPQVSDPVFDGYGFVVGSAPTRKGVEPVFHLLSETDVRSTVRRPDSDTYRRWEVAGTAHSGWSGQVYRAPLSERDLGAAPSYNCVDTPFSRAPLHHVLHASFDHLAAWTADDIQPPSAPYLEFNANNQKVRNELGLAQGGIQLSQVAVPTAINTGSNLPADASSFFCVLFGSYAPFDDATLAELYRNHGRYVSAVTQVDNGNVKAGYVVKADAKTNRQEAAHSDVGKR